MGGTTTSFSTWPVVSGSAAGKSVPTSPPPNGSSGPSLIRKSSAPGDSSVKSTMTSARSAGASSSWSSVTGAGRKPPSAPIWWKGSAGGTRPRGTRIGHELEDQEAGVAAVQEPEPVAARLDLQQGPGAAIDDHRVAEDLRVPDRRHVALGDVGTGEVVEVGAARRVEERAVRGEGAVLDGDRDLVVARPRGVAEGGRRVRARTPAGRSAAPPRRR